MLGIIGIIPEDLEVIEGFVSFEGNYIKINNHKISIVRGTPALIAAAYRVLDALEKNPEEKIYCFLVGDKGKGIGSRKLYQYLLEKKNWENFKVLTFHYIMPDADMCAKVLLKLENLENMPFLIADAGFMYAAKMCGFANKMNLFTPDLGELAFLADEKAPHPFYTRGFILRLDDPYEMIKRAYKHNNLPDYLLVKGEKDLIVKKGKVIEEVSTPYKEEMEAIGGTGDTLTGIVSALIMLEIAPEKACFIGAKINRKAGYLSVLNPAIQIMELIFKIPEAVDKIGRRALG